MSRLYMAENQNNKALDCYSQLLTDEDILANEQVKIQIYGELGVVYYNMKDYVHSIRCFERSEQLLDLCDFEEYRPMLNCNIAKTLIKAGDLRRAEELLDYVERRCVKENLVQVILADVYYSKAELYSKSGNYALAYDYMHKSFDLQNKLGRQEINDILNHTNPLLMQKKVETTIKAEKHIKGLENQLQQEQAASKKIGFVSSLTGGVLILMVGVSILLLFLLRRKSAENARLRRNNDEQHRVMSIIAHDFINPFNSLIGFTELQMQYSTSQNDSEMMEYSRQVYRSTQTLYEFFCNVLTWSRLGSKLQAHKTSLNIASEVEHVVNSCRLMAEEKCIRINVSVDEADTIYADQNHLGIMLRNIVSNALKFTPANGRVTISAYTYRGKTSISIEDTGAGISAETIRRVNLGEQAESTTGTNNEKGIGLGLRICHDMMAANGGQMDISSVEGQGTNVTLVFDNKQVN